MQHAKYIRLYADEDGESHFEELDITLSPVDFAPPAEPLNIAQFIPTERSFWLGAPAGWAGETPHPTPQRQIFCVLQGEWAVKASDGTIRHYTTGSVLLLEDTWGKGHSTRVITDGLILGMALAESES